MHLHEAMRLPLEKHSNLARWIEDIEAQIFWQKTQGAVEKSILPNKQGKQQTNGTTACPTSFKPR